MRCRRSNLVLAGAVTALSLTPVTVSAEPAMVINSGRDGTECAGPLNPPMEGYFGHASVINTMSGELIIRCNADVLGDPPDETIVLPDWPGPPGTNTTCKVIITKGGKLNATCHN